MDTTAEQLLEILMADAGITVDGSILLDNIEHLNAVDDRFIHRALLLSESSYPEAREDLRTYLTDEPGMPRVTKNAAKRNSELGTDLNVAAFVLNMITCVNSIASLSDAMSLPRLRLFSMASFSDRLIIRRQVAIRPDVMETSPAVMDRYFHPLAVAAFVLKAHGDEQRFLDAAPEFITWAGQQEDIPATLATALRLNTLNTTTVEAITRITKETEPALRSGVL